MTTVLILPATGGAGATTLAIGLALSFARPVPKKRNCPETPGKTVVLAELGEPAADILSSTAETAVSDIGDVYSGTMPVKDASLPFAQNVFLLRGRYLRGPVTGEQVAALQTAAKEANGDVLLLDASGKCVLEHDVFPLCDRVLVVTPATPVALRATEALGVRLLSSGVPRFFQIVNGFVPSRRFSLSRWLDDTRVPLLGLVPLSADIAEDMDRCRAGCGIGNENDAAAFSNVARRVLGEELPLLTGFHGVSRREWLR